MSGMNNVNIRNLDLNLLVLFVILWETRNVTRAGERLALSQSAVSHGLRRLRERLGDELFVYGRNGLLPTPRASELIAPVREALDKIEQALQGSERFSPARAKRKFRIAASDYVEFAILPALIEHTNRLAPGVVFKCSPFLLRTADKCRACSKMAKSILLWTLTCRRVRGCVLNR